MPKLMEKKERMQAVASIGASESIWFDNISTKGGVIPVTFPEGGVYQVILVKIGGDVAEAVPKRKSARDYIGYSRRYRPEWRSTAEAMRELREGEELPSAPSPMS